MMNMMGLNRKRASEDLHDIEEILQSNLKPVSPRPEFIQNLQKGLMEYTFLSPDDSEVDLLKTVVFAFVGFAGLVFVLSLWVRLMVVIISTLGMIQSSRRKKAY
ncbi:MAG: hypothetical protein A2136_11265 [Chloroflexi bacterium RBG_16_54_11]|nr:MAG: hypothetical protein A2136_11265 [Chloroflexi bacterium RBG_16_54_11]